MSEARKAPLARRGLPLFLCRGAASRSFSTLGTAAHISSPLGTAAHFFSPVGPPRASAAFLASLIPLLSDGAIGKGRRARARPSLPRSFHSSQRGMAPRGCPYLVVTVLPRGSVLGIDYRPYGASVASLRPRPAFACLFHIDCASQIRCNNFCGHARILNRQCNRHHRRLGHGTSWLSLPGRDGPCARNFQLADGLKKYFCRN